MIIIDDKIKERLTKDRLKKLRELSKMPVLQNNTFIWQGKWHKEDFLEKFIKDEDNNE